ncbi:hypothetical protein PZH44_16115, partial [Alistipes putredinis]|nr:hypothetical protein [Alistipes putredinis]
AMKLNNQRPILRRAAIPAVLALLCTLFWYGKPNDFGLGRNMELLVNMMRELSLFYVDEVDPDQLMQVRRHDPQPRPLHRISARRADVELRPAHHGQVR